MEHSEAQDLFAKAGQLYLDGRYDEALDILTTLDERYPNNHRVLKAKARTLGKIGRLDEAIALCDRLIDEFNYEKARQLRDKLQRRLHGGPADDSVQGPSDDDKAYPLEVVEEVRESDHEPMEGGVHVVSLQPKERRFKIKPIRLLILVAIAVGVYLGYVPWWLGVGIVGAYFVIKYAIRAALYRLFTLPFKMKGKALDGATVEMHGFEWTQKPTSEAGDDEDENESKPKVPLEYAWIDVTISPPPRTQGFTHWEPGELALAPYKTKIKSLDDMDKCFHIHDYKHVVAGKEFEEGEEDNDEEEYGMKVHGPHRIKVLVGLPQGEREFKFVYYSVVFGRIDLVR
ncbi:MAG: hypothetical protein AMXMBFR84_42250 [Candidatus Hydrogenedentota bacterium]